LNRPEKLVEGEEVLAIVGTIGTAGNIAISKYLKQQQGAAIARGYGFQQAERPGKSCRGTTVFYLSAENEARIYARWLLKNKPNAKIGVLVSER